MFRLPGGKVPRWLAHPTCIQTGIAIGQTPENWLKVGWPVNHPDPAWALWDENTWCHGRDPHVIQYNGKYYMFLTALTADAKGAVAHPF